MRVGIALGVGLLCLACIGVVAASEPPLASAGLDQDARANTTVYLDAGGSVDPDGSIERYEWTIETPDGNTTTPDCTNCAKTSFVPEQTGQYNATVRVRGADGLSQSDTLYVTVSAPLDLPSPSSGGGVGGAGSGFGGSGGGLGTWNAIVNEGDDLVLSTTRGSDFVIDSPLGQVRIDSSVLDRVREPDGDVHFDGVEDYFQAAGLSEEMIRDVTSRSLSEGGTCKSTQGDCTTSIPDDEELTEEARRKMGLYSEYESESSSNEPETHVTDSKDNFVADITGTVRSYVGTALADESGGKDSLDSPSSSADSDDDHSNDEWDNSASSTNEDSRERKPSDDDQFGSPVP